MGGWVGSCEGQGATGVGVSSADYGSSNFIRQPSCSTCSVLAQFGLSFWSSKYQCGTHFMLMYLMSPVTLRHFKLHPGYINMKVVLVEVQIRSLSFYAWTDTRGQCMGWMTVLICIFGL